MGLDLNMSGLLCLVIDVAPVTLLGLPTGLLTSGELD